MKRADPLYYYDLFQYAPDAYLVTDGDGIIQEANRAAAALLGIAQDRLVGRALAVFFSKEQQQLLVENLASLQKKSDGVEVEVHVQSRQGKAFSVAVKVAAAPASDGKSTVLYWLLRNVAQRRRQEDRQCEERDIQVQYHAVLAERERISRELHDSLGQVLGWLNLKTEQALTMLRQQQSTATAQILAEVLTVIRQTYADVRADILGLRTTIMPGQTLQMVLAEYLARFSRESGITAHLSVPPDDIWRLSPLAELHLLRIIQEALTNVRKYSAAKNVWVSLSREGNDLLATVEDDGRGFLVSDISGSGFGLSIMRERAQIIGGQLTIDSQPGQGTRICLHLPPTVPCRA